MIEPSDSQWRAINMAKTWFTSTPRAPVFRLFGPAGSGKTEIAKFIIQELGLDMSEVIAMTFTGKAAAVLGRRGFPNASTIHSNLYNPLPRGKGRVPELQEQVAKLKAEGAEASLIERIEKELQREIAGVSTVGWTIKADSPIRGAKLCLVDEVSMVDSTIGEDMLSFNVPILVLGDPYQLPPVFGTGFFTQERPDALLTEIHRQAADSAVIRLATMARETGQIPYGVYSDPSGHDSVVTGTADPDKLMAMDQLLCGHNATRHRTNAFIRGRRGIRDFLPVKGDRLICLKNKRAMNLMNGSLHMILEDPMDVDAHNMLINVNFEDFPHFEPQSFLAHKRVFGGDMKTIPPWEWENTNPFDYAYALTVHKFQGSQAPHVGVKAEWNNRETWKQWLYTALTRAQLSNYVII